MTALAEILKLAQRAGVAHNNGAGGQYILCATEGQLVEFADALATPAAASEPVAELRAFHQNGHVEWALRAHPPLWKMLGTSARLVVQVYAAPPAATDGGKQA